MRLNLFSEGDSVLLVGEGNFSFSVELIKHKLPISVVATCFEEEVIYEKQRENIEFLTRENVPIFLNVDATKLHENKNLNCQRFNKIIFNFPHVGGKMKIQLNRQLLKNFFKSVSHIMIEGDIVILSLCQGQGGTPIDHPQRKWSDTWQVTEMAAHGGFYLNRVEPFQQENFQKYTCIGYRSQDIKFNLEGALVHIFVRKSPPFECISLKTIEDRMIDRPLTRTIEIAVPVFYSEMYTANPLLNPKSPVSFFQDLLIRDLKEMYPNESVKILTDKQIQVHMSNTLKCGGIDSVHNEYNLRRSAFDILHPVLQHYTFDGIVLFPGMYFPTALPIELLQKSPFEFQFLLVGDQLLNVITQHIENLIKTFKMTSTIASSEKQVPPEEEMTYTSGLFSIQKMTELICEEKTKGVNSFLAATVLFLSIGQKEVQSCILHIGEICEYFFKTNSWKEMWSDINEVHQEGGGVPILKKGLLFPSSYKMDMTLRYNTKEGFSEEKMKRTLCRMAGWLIENVELVNEYDSEEEWSSKCYRITYRSIDRPLCREKVVRIHSDLIGPALELGMNVSVG